MWPGMPAPDQRPCRPATARSGNRAATISCSEEWQPGSEGTQKQLKVQEPTHRGVIVAAAAVLALRRSRVVPDPVSDPHIRLSHTRVGLNLT